MIIITSMISLNAFRFSVRVLALCLISGFYAAFAQTDIPIENPSFEAIQINSGGQSTSVPGWAVGGNIGQGTFRPTASSYQASLPDGFNVAFITNGPNPLIQVLDETMEFGMEYILQVDVGNRRDTNFADYIITLESNGEVLATGANFAPINGQFLSITTRYIVQPETAGQQLAIRLDSLATDGLSTVNFDNVRLSRRPVPFNLGGEHSGSYVIDGLNDQGFFITIGETQENGQFIFVTWFTYDELGNPLWLAGNDFFSRPDGTQSIILDMVAFSGLEFNQPSTDRANQETYGIMQLTLEDCGLISMAFDFDERGNGRYMLDKITNIEGRDDCVNPFAIEPE